MTLWPDSSEEEHNEEITNILSGKPFYKNELTWRVYVAKREEGTWAVLLRFPSIPSEKAVSPSLWFSWRADTWIQTFGVRELAALSCQ